MKGTPEEKLVCEYRLFMHSMIVKRTDILRLVSFKLYDVDHDGYLTKTELERVMLQLVNTSAAIAGHILSIVLYYYFIVTYVF